MIHHGDALDVLRGVPGESVQCVVTSPPYWGLRSYLPDDDPDKSSEIGLERTPQEYIAKLVAVFAEVRRVLKKDGTLFVNIGDCFATGAGAVGEHPGGGEQGARWKGTRPSGKSTLRGNGHVGGGPKAHAVPPIPVGRGIHTPESGKHLRVVKAMGPMTQPNRMPLQSLKPKDLVGIPWMLAFALRADGWYLRADNIWEKPNAMPSSVKDRTTRSHEYVFHFAKSERYYYDSKAIQEPMSDAVKRRPITNEFSGERPNVGFKKSGTPDRRSARRNKSLVGVCASTQRTVSGFNARFDEREKNGTLPDGRNKRSVWRIPTQPFRGEHFAVMPEGLARICILAGSRPSDVILDPFAGAGTVGVVCEKLGRRFVGIELNQNTVPMAERRIRAVAPLFQEAHE